MKEMVSVIMTTYNHEYTIGRALDSILMQQCHLPIEIMLGEDCSTDGTLAVCQAYAKKYPAQIRLIANQQNKGVVDNYFDCLLLAQGKYIADCAGDDFWTDPLKLEKELAVLEAHPEVTIVHTDWLYYNEKTKQSEPHTKRQFDKPLTDGKDMLEAILTQTRLPVVHLCTALFRKEDFLRVYEEDTFVFRNKEFGCEDLSLTFMLARQGKVAYLPSITLHYSVCHESVSFSDDAVRQFHFVRRVSMLTFYLSQKYHIKGKTINSHLRERLYALSMHAFRAHSKELGQAVLSLGKEWGIGVSWKTRLILAITSNALLWHSASAARHFKLFCRRMLK